MPISMEKIQTQAPNLVKFASKAQFAVSKHGLEGQPARVALCLDYSISASEFYRSGSMQAAAERILAVGTQFDDDGSIDVFAFDDHADHIGELTLDNYEGGINRLLGRRQMGSTNYAAAFEAVTNHYGFTGGGPKRGLFRRATPTGGGDRSVPVFCVFLTDGNPNREDAAKAALIEASKHPVFFQAAGIGSARFDFLKKLDNLRGRTVDNAGFFTAPDIASMPDLPLLDALLNEFPAYITSARAAGVLA